MDAASAEKCCDCWEHISEKEGKDVLSRANEWAKKQQDGKIPYKMDASLDPTLDSPPHMDCSYFVQKALGKQHLPDHFNPKLPQRISTRVLDGTCRFRRLRSNEKPRAGDVLAQPRDFDVPGSQHVGIATGQAGSKGGHVGIAMSKGRNSAGNTAPSVWGLDIDDGGNFDHADQMKVYRPQKPKPNCSPATP